MKKWMAVIGLLLLVTSPGYAQHHEVGDRIQIRPELHFEPTFYDAINGDATTKIDPFKAYLVLAIETREGSFLRKRCPRGCPPPTEFWYKLIEADYAQARIQSVAENSDNVDAETQAERLYETYTQLEEAAQWAFGTREYNDKHGREIDPSNFLRLEGK